MTMQLTITVFGSSDPRPGEAEYEIAMELGTAVAQAGWVLCNGSYGGTMAASCRGAVEAGGKTIGVSCSAFGRSGANQWVQREVTSDDLNERLSKLIDLGDAYVILPGSTGTLLELAAVWELSHKRFLRDRPILLLGDYWMPVIDLIGRGYPRSLAHVNQTDTVAETIAIIRDRLAE